MWCSFKRTSWLAANLLGFKMYFTYTRRAQPFKFASYPRDKCVSVETRTFSSSNSHVSHLQSLSRLEQSFPSACRISNPNVSRDSRWFGPCRIRSRETNGLISRVHGFFFHHHNKKVTNSQNCQKTRWNKHVPYLQSILDIFQNDPINFPKVNLSEVLEDLKENNFQSVCSPWIESCETNKCLKKTTHSNQVPSELFQEWWIDTMSRNHARHPNSKV